VRLTYVNIELVRHVNGEGLVGEINEGVMLT